MINKLFTIQSKKKSSQAKTQRSENPRKQCLKDCLIKPNQTNQINKPNQNNKILRYGSHFQESVKQEVTKSEF